MKCPKCQSENPEAKKFCRRCGARLELICPECGAEILQDDAFCGDCGHQIADILRQEAQPTAQAPEPSPLPASFCDGRYQIKEPIGEGGTKRVYLAHDTVLDRDVALSLIKMEGLDETNRVRVKREAQAMGQLGSHQNTVAVYDLGEENGQPYIVNELMAGDVAGLIEKTEDHRLPIEQVIDIATSVCQGLGFAHNRGIIHRDLKPGNVFLTADGVVKIGDFGLALVDDHTRLTQTDGVLGTFLYSSPEQASGGEVTVRSDLYSLGAMVYETVTGRPPFLGDDSVSIIGQHLNNPPVNPSFYRPDVPRPLEALILRLLAKDPQKRPTSTSDVLSGLKSIGAGGAPATADSEAPADISPIYRRVFVGREAELKQLKAAFDDACSGNGSLAMVVGEPGIGKTALCEELKTYVGIRGGQTLVGHCYEEGSLSLPYLAFVEAMRSYVLERDPDDLRQVLGTGAAHVGRIVSEIRDRLQIEPPELTDPEEERYRLMQSVSEFLSHAASIQPMLIVLEDLHDADQGTLDMLAFISRQLSVARMLIVGNYRDVEVDRAHPLSKSLAELRRATDYGRVLLRGLNADEVQRMLSAITGQDMPWGIAEDVYRSTEGNPLFVQEVLRHLVEDGQIRREEGRWLGFRESEVTVRIPEGLKEVIGKRLSALSSEANRLLSIAAVIGREFPLGILQEIAGSSEEELYHALEQAQNAAIIEAHTGVGAVVRYRFTHAFFRQTLYEETIAPRRIRMHQQVARALESSYANRLAEHAVELADHFSYSSNGEDLAKAVSYGKMAADRAMSVFDSGEAVRLLEQTLQVQDVLNPDDKAKRCDLLIDLGYALVASGEPRRAFDNEVRGAFSLSVETGDDKLTSRVCRLALTALQSYGANPAITSPEGAEWALRADEYAKPGTVERVWADVALGRVNLYGRKYPECRRYLDQALDLAKSLGDPAAHRYAASSWIVSVWSPDCAEKQRLLAEEMTEYSREGKALSGPWFVLLAHGRRGAVEGIWDEQRSAARHRGQKRGELTVKGIDCREAYLEGRLEEAIAITDEMEGLGDELGLRESTAVGIGVTRPRAEILLGRHPRQPPGMGHRVLNSPAEYMLAYTSPNVDMSRMLSGYHRDRETLTSSESMGPSHVGVLYLESAVLREHKGSSELLYGLLKGCGIHTTGELIITSTGRVLGMAAAFLQKPDAARGHYRNAIEVTTDMRFRPELALTRYQMAELLLEHYPDERDEALEHLDFSLEEFKEMKMKPYIEKAQALKESL